MDARSHRSRFGFAVGSACGLSELLSLPGRGEVTCSTYSWPTRAVSTNTKLGYMLPVFDAGYAVVSSSGGLPATPMVDWLHSAPVDVLIASLTFGWPCGLHRFSFSFAICWSAAMPIPRNGVGGSRTTMRRHWLPGLSQFFGNLLGVLGGAGAYAVGGSMTTRIHASSDFHPRCACVFFVAGDIS